MNILYKIPAFPRHLLILIVSVVFQLLFFNYLDISKYYTICFYLFFILTLPVKIKKIFLLLVCAAYGVILDYLLSTGGIFTMTTTFIGFIRPTIIRLFFVKDEQYNQSIPTSSEMGAIAFILYTFIVVLISMLFITIIERLSFQFFYDVLIQCILSSVATTPIIFFVQLMFFGRRTSR